MLFYGTLKIFNVFVLLRYTENPDGHMTYEDGVWTVINPDYPGKLLQNSSSPFFPNWIAPWYEVDEDGNVVREWPAVQVQCEHELERIPSNYPTFTPTVYPECEYHELKSVSVGSSDPIDIVFVIDAVIGDDDPRWQDTVTMLTDVIT